MRKKFLTILMSMLMVFVMMPMGTWTTYAAGGNLIMTEVKKHCNTLRKEL